MRGEASETNELRGKVIFSLWLVFSSSSRLAHLLYKSLRSVGYDLVGVVEHTPALVEELLARWRVVELSFGEAVHQGVGEDLMRGEDSAVNVV